MCLRLVFDRILKIGHKGSSWIIYYQIAHYYAMECPRVQYWAHIGLNLCDLASCLCKYDLRKGDLFVLSWARERQVNRGSFSSELLMCVQYLLLPLVTRCLETIDVCIWHMFVFMSVLVTVWGLWECLLCSGRC